MQAVAGLHKTGRSHGIIGMAKVRVLLRQNNTVERCTLLGLGNSELCFLLGTLPARAMLPYMAHQGRSCINKK